VAAARRRREVEHRSFPAGNNVTDRFPELADLAQPHRLLLLHGELVTLDPVTGRPDFELLQTRIQTARPSPSLLRARPVVLYAFDLLANDTTSLLDSPYQQDVTRLAERAPIGQPLQVPPHWIGQGAALLDVARAHQIEGVVSKRIDSLYQPGRRSRSWIKTALTRTHEVVISGWTPGQGRRTGTIGALLLGVHDDAGRLAYVGQVGTGFTTAALTRLTDQLARLARRTSPFTVAPVPYQDAHDAQWVRPDRAPAPR
jgi:bifunctional non-homologous end joining protein LigD